MTALCASFAISATTALAADSSASETARPAVGAAPVNVTVPGVSPAQVLNASYQIHPSDVLNVQVFGDTALTQTATVLPDGTINYPLVGRIDVGGKTADQAAATIKNSLLKYVRHPVVTVAISQQGQYNVLVLGNVKQPGKYPVRSDARLTDAIAAAGGLGPTNGNLPPARVSVGDQNGQLVSLQKLFHDGDVSQNIPLREGSVVYVVAPNTIKVEVLGAVDKPGDLDINEGDRLSIAIARAGNSTKSNADLNHIRVTRQGPDGKPVVYEVNLYNALERGDLRYDMVLVKNDVVYVPVSHTGSATGNGVMNLLGRLLWL
jgi:polysaccharide export outer membrane protein